MSTTPHFFASGAGNGFTTCLEEVDVSEYDYWCTLGGFKKGDAGSPTPAQIDLSFRNAWKLFWLLEGMTGEASVTGEVSVTALAMGATTYAEYEDLAGINRIGEIGEPFKRVCGRNWKIENEVTVTPDGYDYTGFIYAHIRLVRMNDGSVFVGYGCSTELGVSARDRGQPLFAHCRLSSFMDDDFSGSSFIHDYEMGYTEVNGIHLVSVAFVEVDPDGGPYGSEVTSTVSASDRTAEIFSDWEPTITVYAELTSFDFYSFI